MTSRPTLSSHNPTWAKWEPPGGQGHQWEFRIQSTEAYTLFETWAPSKRTLSETCGAQLQLTVAEVEVWRFGGFGQRRDLWEPTWAFEESLVVQSCATSVAWEMSPDPPLQEVNRKNHTPIWIQLPWDF
ncbi:hypothetical protein EYF80_013024 [Liparis tanakae]|uniref:Uncharacterized protein n=1 Tax=Liparis tanakae TaxID=230148 RepID=A0A4Z2IGI7_9TELE|nr:hypothetical protein EYF80_013024 [Liparis tanakae]